MMENAKMATLLSISEVLPPATVRAAVALMPARSTEFSDRQCARFPNRRTSRTMSDGVHVAR
jgi:hypothetical protein